MDGWIGKYVERRNWGSEDLNGLPVKTQQEMVELVFGSTCLQTLCLMQDITGNSKVKENQLESFEPGVAHSNLTDHVTLEIVVGVSMWSLSDGHCLGPSHFI